MIKNQKLPVVVFDMDLENIDEDENVILRLSLGQFSADPRICLVPYSLTL